VYPRTYYETFMRYEASNEVFVAMPFNLSFRKAFETIIEPAVKGVTVNGNRLVPRIINRATTGAPDIHEKIFDAILHCRLVIADMTVQASYAADDGVAKWQANANVAYEVGLASAWRNPEDVLLLYQPHANHSYSFDVQNLRHFTYKPSSAKCVSELAAEIVAALNQSSFLAKLTYQKILESVSPSSIQFMHQEARRAFPVVAFHDDGMPIMDARIHAATELLACGAIKNRNVFSQGDRKGVAIIYEWTELGLRMLVSLHAISVERQRELLSQISSVPSDAIPPAPLREFPAEKEVEQEKQIDMTEATSVDTSKDQAKQIQA
jgi:hypothetical protein